jgi:hypothetical protein
VRLLIREKNKAKVKLLRFRILSSGKYNNNKKKLVGEYNHLRTKQTNKQKFFLFTTIVENSFTSIDKSD